MTNTRTPYGVIHHGGPCKDDYANIKVWTEPDGVNSVKLQAPALRAFRNAVDKVGRSIPICGHGWRSCEYQAELYASDHERYAPPSKSLHPRGLALDLGNMGPLFKRRVWRALKNQFWHQPMPSSEPWHFSYFIEG